MNGRRCVLSVLACVAALAVVTTGALAQEPDEVAVAEPGRVAFSFVGRIEQNGPLAVDVGYLTSVDGLEEAQLFTGDDPLNRGETTARFTYFAEARLEFRSVNGNLFVTGGTAETRLFLQPDGGADFDDPTSFRRGTEIASFQSRWHDIVNVQAPNEGIARVESDDTQLSASPFELGGEQLRFGRPGEPLRLSFTGQGTRSQAEPPRATILYGGEATALAGAADGFEQGASAAEVDTSTETSPWVWVALALAAAAFGTAIASLAFVLQRRATG